MIAWRSSQDFTCNLGPAEQLGRRTSGDADDFCSFRHIFYDRRAGPDDGIVSYCDALNYRRACADKGTLANLYVTRQDCPGRNMGMCSDQTVMVNLRTGINDGVIVNFNIRLNDGARHYLGAGTDGGTRGDNCSGVYHRLKPVSFVAEGFIHGTPLVTFAPTTNTIC